MAAGHALARAGATARTALARPALAPYLRHGRHWPSRAACAPWPFAWVDVAWAVFSLANLAAIVIFSHWETVPFHFIWISLTLLYGFRVWSTRPTAWVLAVVMITTGAAIGWDVYIGAQTVDELNEVPLMAAMFWMMVWHAQRRLAADNERDLVSEENARLLATQRRFLQDASHQLRTPITIALGHAELLASDLAGRTEARDIEVVVGELDQAPPARGAAADDRRVRGPGLPAPRAGGAGPVHPGVVPQVAAHHARGAGRSGAWIRCWSPPTGNGSAWPWTPCWRTRSGTPATGEEIQLSVLRDHDGRTARMIVADSGEGIAPAELDRIFDRFRSGSALVAAPGAPASASPWCGRWPGRTAARCGCTAPRAREASSSWCCRFACRPRKPAARPTARQKPGRRCRPVVS